MNHDSHKTEAVYPKSCKPKPARKVRDCEVCFGPHDEKIHAASIRVRLWFGEEVRRSFETYV